MSSYWKGKRVLVTGGAGFVGHHLCEALFLADAVVTCLDIKKPHINIKSILVNLFDTKQCLNKIKNYDVVVHLAAKVGGILYNIKYPSDIYLDNLLMFSNVIKAVSTNKIPNLLLVSSACVYPGDAIVPTPESEGFRGDPEETNIGYGWSKRALEIAGKILHKQYGTNVAIVRPFNIYGPGDNYDPEDSHVIAALIQKIMTADGTLEVMGSGEQTRSFLYVKDAVKGMMQAMEKSHDATPVNLGGGGQISIKDLTTLLLELTGKKLEVSFSVNAPQGYKNRGGDTERAKLLLSFKNDYTLEVGLTETLGDYKRVKMVK